MFIRSELKQRAKDSIHRNLLIVIGTCLVASILTSSYFGTQVNLDTGQYYFRMGLGDFYVISLDFITLAISASLAIIISLISMVYTIFISNPLKVGMVRCRKGHAAQGHLYFPVDAAFYHSGHL
ncbi:hypothetical protein [uncultured Traorella sp.]|uniref:hypothetical protein n=1 Tax=uncultured Traorella sp. TaxID=1929048 RepID=UPI0025E742D1|nr:hypothetical protein [uncultured Traorella sp.]